MNVARERRPEPAANEIIGRVSELESIRLFLEHKGGAPSALVLQGEPGIGKSTLWNAGVAAAGEFGRLLYRGQPFPAFGTSLGDKRKRVYIYLTAGPYPMPGPLVVRAARRLGGSSQVLPERRPDRPILHVRACLTSRTAAAGPTRACARDESSTAFSSTDSIACSAVFAGGKCKLAGIAFLREGKTEYDGDFELPLPITAAGPRLDPDPKLATGKWACRWSLAGRVLAEKQFRIAS